MCLSGFTFGSLSSSPAGKNQKLEGTSGTHNLERHAPSEAATSDQVLPPLCSLCRPTTEFSGRPRCCSAPACTPSMARTVRPRWITVRLQRVVRQHVASCEETTSNDLRENARAGQIPHSRREHRVRNFEMRKYRDRRLGSPSRWLVPRHGLVGRSPIPFAEMQAPPKARGC